MLSLAIDDGDLIIKDIDKIQLYKIADWSNTNYRYAMGVDKQITIEDLHEKYLEVLINAQEFFLSINFNGEFVGFVKGRVDLRDEGEIWIMSMLIDGSYQKKGVGRRVLNLIMDEFNERLGITSFYAFLVNDNIEAKTFWERNGFSEYRSTKGYFTIDNKSHDLTIMHKDLKS